PGRGARAVVGGVRSGVFAPLPSLRLIVVDEEHEPAYKQSEQLRYHGRDTAVRRAQMLGVPVVLGSGSRGRYRVVRLDRRVDGRAQPAARLVDLRTEPRGGSLVSRPLVAAL